MFSTQSYDWVDMKTIEINDSDSVFLHCRSGRNVEYTVASANPANASGWGENAEEQEAQMARKNRKPGKRQKRRNTSTTVSYDKKSMSKNCSTITIFVEKSLSNISDTSWWKSEMLDYYISANYGSQPLHKLAHTSNIPSDFECLC